MMKVIEAIFRYFMKNAGRRGFILAVGLTITGAILLFALPTSAFATTYYVRADGNNNCNGLYDAAGLSGNCAWKTLQKAADNVSAGDTVLVGNGTYTGFYTETGGASGSPITFKAQSSGANITSRNSRTADCINLESWDGVADYIIVDGFNVSGCARMGIRAIAGTGIIIQNNTVYNNGDCGIFSGGTPSIQVLYNTTYGNGSTILQHNIYISNAGSDYPVIRGNHVYSSGGGSGIQLNGDWLEGGDGFIDHGIIEDNIIHDNAAKGMSLISIRYGTIQNNVIYNQKSGAGGIHIVDQQGSHYSINNTVVNNTIHEPNIACVRVNSDNTDNVVFNNICVGSTGIVFEGSGNYQSNNYGSSSVGSLFVNAASRNYHLVSGSAAIGYGVTSYRSRNAPVSDKDGLSRNIAYDAGAYEYGGSAPAQPPTAPQNLRVLD